MREELKYVMPVEVLGDLRRAIKPFVQLDEHGRGYENRGYTVRSVYLDSPSLVYYHEKQSHLQHRKKIRIRGYNERGADERVFLEIKRKSNSAISKERAPMRFADVPALFASGRCAEYIGSRDSEHRDVARRVCYHVFRRGLRPTALVVYEREAFQGRFDRTFRITLDRNLRGRMYPALGDLYDEDALSESMPGTFVMEVKFSTRMPAWMRQVLGAFGLAQRAVSKYCICVDSAGRPVDTRTAVLACSAPADNSLKHDPRDGALS